jgi:hypothetical protein
MKWANGNYIPTNPEKYAGNRSPKYRSSWELAFFRFADNHPAVVQWASESIKIPYQNPFTGKNTVYVPDIFIVYQDKNGKQHAELIEIKPSSQTRMEAAGKNAQNQAAVILNYAKWQAAAAWCKQKGIFFRVISEKDLFKK